MTASEAPQWTGRGPGPYALAYGAMLFNGLILIASVQGAGGLQDFWFRASLIGFAIACATLLVARAVVHDTLIALPVAARTFFVILIGVVFFIPGMIPGHSALPEGFGVALPLVTLTAISGPGIRRWMLFSLAGFWGVCISSPPPSLPMILVFGFSLLWVFAAAYFAETGEPYGLRGWWPARTTLFLALLYFAPAALVAGGTYFLWPDLVPPNHPDVAPPVTARAAMELDPVDLQTLLLRFFVWLGLVLISFILITIIRRRLGRRRRPGGIPKVFGMDLGDLQFFRAPETRRARGLQGQRGRIVRLWMKWANELGRGRGESETAREVAGRVSQERGDSPERLTLTEIFERAHYGPDEPTAEQAEAMKKAVRGDLRR